MKSQILNKSVLAAVVCGLAACSLTMPAQSVVAWTPLALQDSHWMDADPPVGRTLVTLDIGKDGHLMGHGGCNHYMGKAQIMERKVRLVQGGSTRMLCAPQALMDTENRFFKAMEQTRSARQEQGQLLLLDESGKVLWRFKPRS
jgi:heat shock protein HslJ